KAAVSRGLPTVAHGLKTAVSRGLPAVAHGLKTAVSEGWRKRLGVEPSHPAQRGTRPILKTGRATGPRSLPIRLCAGSCLIADAEPIQDQLLPLCDHEPDILPVPPP